MKYYIKEMRIKHYIKNFLIVLPLFFSGEFFFSSKLVNAGVAIVAFSLMSSAVYFINDIQDIEKDRKHPTKRNRPIASGDIPVKNAYIFAAVLVLVSLIISYWLYLKTGNFLNILVVIAYFVINLLYSIAHFKNIPLLDVSIIVFGFFLRLFMGSISTGIHNSSWIYLVVISGAFYLGFGKRRSEYLKVGKENNTRESLKLYNFDFLDKTMHSCMTLAIAFFALWCKEKQDLSGNILYLLLVPLMMMICFKYNMNIESDEYDGDPVSTILADKVLLGLLLLMAVLFFVALYI